jgi:16S rRNA G966 N2-methylase RsmD
MKVERAPERLAGPYTLVLADPPYEDDTAIGAVERVAESPLVTEETTLVLEHSSRRAAPEQAGKLHRTWSRRYGDTEVSIYRHGSERGEAVT